MSFAYNNMINVIGDIMAQYKIAVDAGHGGSDYGATYNGRAEKDDNLKLALAVGDILEKNGIDVVYTRTTDEYETPFKKATDANDAKADYFVSIHRNSSPTPNQYTGVETLVYNNSGIKSQMAANINSELKKAGFKNLGITERPNLVVLKRTKMPAVLVEAGFINNDKDNETFDKNFNQIANGIADGILKTLGITPKNDTSTRAASSEVPTVKSDSAENTEIMPTNQNKKPSLPSMPVCGCDDDMTPEPLYRVQVGAYRNKDNADRMLNSLLVEGFPAFIIYEDDYYKVQVGAFRQLSNAIKMEQKLRKFRYSTYIVYS
ncbi:MAG TPA: N-acetylmuramoyl-L-alanine amidase [Eubacterium sp.]|nr:N-acetylmuramoyl-L-alanine amidase [Eubacterium sp.]HCO35198.1 N-acetylmuramoyl-L-alanine amidase [Eubacterium sp.]